MSYGPHFNMHNLGPDGRPNLMKPIKCKYCEREFTDFDSFKMHKSNHRIRKLD